jgi:hypothetical protein
MRTRRGLYYRGQNSLLLLLLNFVLDLLCHNTVQAYFFCNAAFVLGCNWPSLAVVKHTNKQNELNYYYNLFCLNHLPTFHNFCPLLPLFVSIYFLSSIPSCMLGNWPSGS